MCDNLWDQVSPKWCSPGVEREASVSQGNPVSLLRGVRWFRLVETWALGVNGGAIFDFAMLFFPWPILPLDFLNSFLGSLACYPSNRSCKYHCILENLNTTANNPNILFSLGHSPAQDKSQKLSTKSISKLLVPVPDTPQNLSAPVSRSKLHRHHTHQFTLFHLERLSPNLVLVQNSHILQDHVT